MRRLQILVLQQQISVAGICIVAGHQHGPIAGASMGKLY